MKTRNDIETNIDPLMPEQIASRDARIAELEAECERLRKAYIQNEFAVKTRLLKAMGIIEAPGSLTAPDSLTAEEFAEILANHTGYRVQKYSPCPKCKGTKVYSYKDYVYDGECICTKPCDECGRTGFVWQTVEVK